MNRRDFLALVAAAAVSPIPSRAEKPLPVIGYLSSTSPGLNAPLLAAFREGLNEIGYVEGQNVSIEYRWAEGRFDRLPALSVELVNRNVDLIVAGGGGV